MKNNNKSELNVDFIGGAGSLTKEEEKAISRFIKASKVRSGKSKAYKSVPGEGLPFTKKNKAMNTLLRKAKLLS